MLPQGYPCHSGLACQRINETPISHTLNKLNNCPPLSRSHESDSITSVRVVEHRELGKDQLEHRGGFTVLPPSLGRVPSGRVGPENCKPVLNHALAGSILDAGLQE